MRVSTKGIYGLRVMIDLAGLRANETGSLKEIAGRQRISEKYLWQVIRLLSNVGLILAIRGPQGGYRLGAPAYSITLRDIFCALEGPCELLGPIESFDGDDNPIEMVSREIWKELEETIVSKMSSITLEQILERCRYASNNIGYVI